MIEFLEPRAEPTAPIEPYTLAIDLSRGPVDVALLANGFPDSENFLERVAESLAEELPELRFHRYNKGDASIVVRDEMLEDIVRECQAVVAAYGH
ncbi:MAG: hypothetical protein HKP27_10045 [Myxococcales bacterium]|nr:hypothetical protein [Myxococcales bacterium]